MLIGERAEDVDVVFRAKPGQLFHVGPHWHGQDSFRGRFAHLAHHPNEAVSGHREDQHGCRDGALVAYSVRNPAREENIPSRTHDGFLAVANKASLPIEYVEGLIFRVVEVIGGSGSGRCDLVYERKSPSGGFGRSLDSV